MSLWPPVFRVHLIERPLGNVPRVEIHAFQPLIKGTSIFFFLAQTWILSAGSLYLSFLQDLFLSVKIGNLTLLMQLLSEDPTRSNMCNEVCIVHMQ